MLHLFFRLFFDIRHLCLSTKQKTRNHSLHLQSTLTNRIFHFWLVLIQQLDFAFPNQSQLLQHFLYFFPFFAAQHVPHVRSNRLLHFVSHSSKPKPLTFAIHSSSDRKRRRQKRRRRMNVRKARVCPSNALEIPLTEQMFALNPPSTLGIFQRFWFEIAAAPASAYHGPKPLGLSKTSASLPIAVLFIWLLFFNHRKFITTDTTMMMIMIIVIVTFEFSLANFIIFLSIGSYKKLCRFVPTSRQTVKVRSFWNLAKEKTCQIWSASGRRSYFISLQIIAIDL